VPRLKPFATVIPHDEFSIDFTRLDLIPAALDRDAPDVSISHACKPYSGLRRRLGMKRWLLNSICLQKNSQQRGLRCDLL